MLLGLQRSLSIPVLHTDGLSVQPPTSRQSVMLLAETHRTGIQRYLRHSAVWLGTSPGTTNKGCGVCQFPVLAILQFDVVLVPTDFTPSSSPWLSSAPDCPYQPHYPCHSPHLHPFIQAHSHTPALFPRSTSALRERGTVMSGWVAGLVGQFAAMKEAVARAEATAFAAEKSAAAAVATANAAFELARCAAPSTPSATSTPNTNKRALEETSCEELSFSSEEWLGRLASLIGVVLLWVLGAAITNCSSAVISFNLVRKDCTLPLGEMASTKRSPSSTSRRLYPCCMKNGLMPVEELSRLLTASCYLVV
jgi:hypothetical protein